jgi:hypothetical protein
LTAAVGRIFFLLWDKPGRGSGVGGTFPNQVRRGFIAVLSDRAEGEVV